MRTRLPIKLKLAVGSAALTFGILCLFAVVIGAVAEQRIVAGFDDDLRATAADLEQLLTIELGPDGRLVIDSEDERWLEGFATGDAIVQVLNRRGELEWAEPGAPDLGPAFSGVNSIDGLRVVSRDLVIAPGAAETFSPNPRPGGHHHRLRPVRQARGQPGPHHRQGAGLSDLRRDRRHAAGLPGRPGGRPPRDAPDRRPHPRSPRGGPDPRPRHHAAQARAPTTRSSELAHTFEDMLQELTAARSETEAALLRQRQFVADASHELRTPLTSILANLELLESELAGEQQEMADSALRSSRRMRRLVADLLLLARADAGRDATMAPVDLAAVAREAAAEASALSDDHPVVVDAPDRVTVTGVADDLHRLAANLVENALIHTPAGTPVTVSVRSEGRYAVLEVADRGPGVPDALRPRVFERFARGIERRQRPSRRQRPGPGDRQGGGRLARRRRRADRRRGRRRPLRGHPPRRDGPGPPRLPLPGGRRSDHAGSVLKPRTRSREGQS